MEENQRLATIPNWPDWLLWTLAGAVGWAIITIVDNAIGSPSRAIPEPPLEIIINGIKEGVVIGFLQWLVLRRWVSGAGWWIVVWIGGAILGGFAISGVAQFALSTNSIVVYRIFSPGHIVGITLLAGSYGAGIGIVQWFFLRRWVYHSFWWVLVSIVAMAISTILRDMIFSPFWFASPNRYWAVILSGTLTQGILGIILIWLWRSTTVSPITAKSSSELSARPLQGAGWSFWGLWILANTLGITAIIIAMTVFHFFGAVVAGFVMGTMQALVLKRYISQPKTWAIATGIGLSILGYFSINMQPTATALFWIAVMGMGGFLGAIQWLILKQDFYESGWWIAANVFGWGLVYAIMLALDFVARNTGDTSEILFLLGVITGVLINVAITGGTFVWLSRTPQ